MSLLIKIAMVVAVVALALAWIKRGRSLPKPGPKNAQPGKQPGTSAVVIVACAHCGVHLPEADACHEGGHPYCSERHRDAGPRR